MKSLMIALLSLGFMATAQAEPGQGSHSLALSGETYVRLAHCGGTAELRQNWLGVVTLQIEDVKDCSVVALDGRALDRLEEQSDGSRAVTVTLTANGRDRSTVDLYSQSRKTSEHFEIVRRTGSSVPQISVTLDPVFRTSAYLPECGGSVEFTATHSQANLVFRNVENCSNFDIVSNNGDSLNYANKKIGTEENRTGSFTLPQKFMDFGVNGVVVVVKSNSGKHQDVVLLKFLAL